MTDTVPREEQLIHEAPHADNGRQVIADLAEELLPVLIARLAASSLGELEMREHGWRIRLRRPAQADGTATDAPRGGRRATTRQVGGQRRAADAARPVAREGRAASRAERPRADVGSPAVGYFVPREGVSTGSVVRGGDAIGQIDVLGVRQEVIAPEDGIVARFEVEPGQAVEYGQAIARLEPRG